MTEPDKFARPLWAVGDKVRKVGGDYGGPGEVVGRFEVKPGIWRYNVAHYIQGGFGRFIHIYSSHQLEDDNAQRRG